MPLSKIRKLNKWSGGLAHWREGNTTFISIVFTWRIDDAAAIAQFEKAQGREVIAGGPAIFMPKMRGPLLPYCTFQRDYPDAIAKHNPAATVASRGCPVGCFFCIVPAMEGKDFTLLPEFDVRPSLSDNNLSALPESYQDEIISRYRAANVPLVDANSGFEPATFTPDVYARWRDTINTGGGPWRFALDEMKELPDVLRVADMLKDEPQKRKRVYVLIGNEPFAECMNRIQTVIESGCEPHVQPYMKLTATNRDPVVRFDWTLQKLRDVARWANGFVWKKAPFSEYSRSMRTRQADARQGEFSL